MKVTKTIYVARVTTETGCMATVEGVGEDNERFAWSMPDDVANAIWRASEQCSRGVEVEFRVYAS